ncbi:MAG TPA: DUF819 family protein [Deltaproteobacteria bacterium]|nr:DUF819 family protein [Deltaproteobacteria bacterium]
MEISMLIVFYLLFPVLVIYLCYRFPAVNKLGAVVICYIVGITLGNIGVLPEGAEQAQATVSETAVALALPLLLFSMDIKRWKHLAGPALLSMILGTASIIVVAFAGFFVMQGMTENPWQLSGMAVGVYTGGTPNLAAIKTALGIDSGRFIVVHTYDTVISIIFIIFCITVARRVFLAYLPPFRSINGAENANGEQVEREDVYSYAGIFSRRAAVPLAASLALSAAIVGISVTAGSLIPPEFGTSAIILLITTLGIAASLVHSIRHIDKTFQLGMYIIYIFCLVVGSMANYRVIVNIDAVIMVFITVAIFGTMFLHSLLCRFFKIDTDTFIITSTSLICSPPFVPVVASGLKNKEIILSGLTTGIIGYAVGNYLGISVALLLKNWI